MQRRRSSVVAIHFAGGISCPSDVLQSKRFNLTADVSRIIWRRINFVGDVGSYRTKKGSDRSHLVKP